MVSTTSDAVAGGITGRSVVTFVATKFGITDSKPPMSATTTFYDLPLELREEIWRLTLPGPRVLAIDNTLAGVAEPAGVEDGSQLRKYVPKKRPTAPVILQVNRESRSFALKFYSPAFARCLSNPVYFDFDRDILHLMLVASETDFSVLNRSRSMRRIQSLALTARKATAPLNHHDFYFPKYTDYMVGYMLCPQIKNFYMLDYSVNALGPRLLESRIEALLPLTQEGLQKACLEARDALMTRNPRLPAIAKCWIELWEWPYIHLMTGKDFEKKFARAL